MKIKITNTEALRAALDAVNGAATTHTAGLWAVADQVQKTEAHLETLGLTKKDRPGAVRVHISGERVSNAYTKKNWSDRVATFIRLERGSSCWFVTAISRAAVGQSGGWSETRLTVAQRDLVTARFQGQFGVLPVPVLPVPVLPVLDAAIAKATGLAAAAPELLAALRRSREFAANTHLGLEFRSFEDLQQGIALRASVLDAADAAIAKAIGGEG